MVYHGDPSIPQPHHIPPATLAELAARMSAEPSTQARRLIVVRARRHPDWGVEWIHASIRRDTGRHDISIPQIAWVLLEMRRVSPAPWVLEAAAPRPGKPRLRRRRLGRST
jgi:hypothetical protein